MVDDHAAADLKLTVAASGIEILPMADAVCCRAQIGRFRQANTVLSR